MRAISAFSLEDGIATSWCCALAALRRRVRKSAMGSVIVMARCAPSRSPARLRHPGDEAVVSQLAQADPADPELAVDGPRAPAAPAAAVAAGLVLGRPLLADSLGNLGHVLLSSVLRWGRGRHGRRRGRRAFPSPRAARRPPRRSGRSW